jgi:hypothetical protein
VARIAAANAILDRGWGKPSIAAAIHNPSPDIVALIAEAQRHAAEAMAVPVSIEAHEPNDGAVG